MKRLAAKLLMLMMGLSLINSSYAVTFAIEKNYSDERESFTKAKKALKQGNRTEFKVLKKSLKDYPLYPYLEYAQLSTSFRPKHQGRVDRFVKHYSLSPVSNRLQHRWLEYLRQRDQWKPYLTAFPKAEHTTTSQQCYFALAQYRKGRKSSAYKAGINLWNVGKSQPKACDKLFAILIRKKQITEPLAWQRYQAAKANGKNKLTRYLKRFFTSPNYKTAYANYEAMVRNPSQLRRRIDLQDQSEPNRSVIIKALRTYAAQDPIKAHREWRYFKQHFDFSEKQTQRLHTSLIKNLIKKDFVQQADAILENNKNDVSSSLIEWRVRQALATQNWSNLRYWIKVLPENLSSEQRWRYWLARAETRMTQGAQLKNHPLIIALAKERGYYGFIAADERQQAYAMTYQKSALTPALINETANNIGLIRARELYWLGEQTSAIREWRDAGASFDKPHWEAAGVAFSDWGWHYIAIISMVKAKAWQDIVVRFPVLHKSVYQQYAAKNHLKAPLLMAITRQESAFNETAVSPSNAKGLMQLLPSTAKYIAKKKSIPYANSTELLSAEKNVSLGSAYFRYLMDKSDDNRPVSIASYNAGPNRVKKWLNGEADKLPIDIWIETIPYSETRRYVQNVLAFSVIYANHIGEKPTLFTYNERNNLL